MTLPSLVGQTFGRLTVTECAGNFPRKNNSRVKAWRCICSCDTPVIVTTGDLRSGRVQSCGCLRSYNMTNFNLTGTR